MPTIIKELPGHAQVATGTNVITQVRDGQTYYLVGAINPYPNDNLVTGNSYSLTDPNHRSLVVALLHPPGGGMMTATFIPQT